MHKSEIKKLSHTGIARGTVLACPWYYFSFIVALSSFILQVGHYFAFAQDEELELSFDMAANTVMLPKVFKPSIDLSGRGFHQEFSWPQELSSPEALETWKKDIGFSGIYRLQYNLWEISQLDKNKKSQHELIANYESVIKNISAAGGIVILNIFGTPAGLGKVLDKKSLPWNLRAFKELVKEHIRHLSCEKKYNVWYEVWSAPDLDDFFLGRKLDYLNLYKAVAESVKELEKETKVNIPIGGPSTSWWFQNLDGNTIVESEKSLIYELIKFCRHYKLPLDFISWHAYSTDPQVEKEKTLYNKIPAALIRDWLSYFNFDNNLPLIIDEWNYDSGFNILSERQENSFICASYIPARLKGMYEANITYQTFFALEDFQDNKEGVKRNVGIFWYEPDTAQYKGGSKCIYNVFKMLNALGDVLFVSSPKPNDEFVGMIATKKEDEIALLLYNYIDPDTFRNYVSRNMSTLKKRDSKEMLNIFTPSTLKRILSKEQDISTLPAGNKVKAILRRAQELNDRATKFMFYPRTVKLNMKNLFITENQTKKDVHSATIGSPQVKYIFSKYVIDSSCSVNCQFIAVEEKEISASELYQEKIMLNPYSVDLIVIKRKPKEAQPQTQPEAKPQPQPEAQPVSQPVQEPKESQISIPSEPKQVQPQQPPVATETQKPQDTAAVDAAAEPVSKEGLSENAVSDQQNDVQKAAKTDVSKKKQDIKEDKD